MHGAVKDTIVALACSLMRPKPKELYEELFAAIKNLNAKLDPYERTINFQVAAIEALRSNSPNAITKRCFLHPARANWRKIKVLHWRKVQEQRCTNCSRVFCSSCTNTERRNLSLTSEIRGLDSQDAN